MTSAYHYMTSQSKLKLESLSNLKSIIISMKSVDFVYKKMTLIKANVYRMIISLL